MADYPFVHVVMTCWNRLRATQVSLLALLDLTDYPAWEVTVVDDFSTDGTRGWLAEEQLRRAHRGKRFGLIVHDRQMGVNVSANEGWQLREGWYCKLDNNAVVRRPDWLRELVELALALGRKRAGIVAYNLELGRRGRAYPVTEVAGYDVIDRSKANIGGKCALVPNWTRARIGYWNTNVGTLYRGADRLYGLRLRLVGLGSYYHPSWRVFVTRIDGQAAGETAERQKWRTTQKRKAFPAIAKLSRLYWTGVLPPDDWSTPL